MSGKHYDVVKYWKDRAQAEGLELHGDGFVCNQDAIVFALSDGKMAAGLSVSGMEIIQNSGINLMDLAESRFNNSLSTLRGHTN